MTSGRFRPDEATLRDAYRTYFGCNRPASEAVCNETRCPDCWLDPSALDKNDIRCTRFKHGASPRASSGLGGWEGGDVRASTRAGAPDEWFVGEGCGEDVEFFKRQPFDDDGGPARAHQRLSSGRILYFFEHRGNKRLGAQERPWVLGFDYVSDGHGRSQRSDPVTLHPVVVLRGRGRPVVFPADAIRRRVHLYHRCPGPEHPPADRAWMCGPAASSTGRGKVWRHKFRLASPGDGACDRFILNEFHHSINRNSIV